jgi:glycosyltransferase involved in cell wall biosynthesis
MARRVLHVMSCRGWSSDAYWAGRIACELERRGHRVTVVARADAGDKVLRQLRSLGVHDLLTLPFSGRRSPPGLLRDLRTLRRWMKEQDVVHVHRGQEHWLAALANRLSPTPRPLVRTRHIAQPVRPHAANRWLYRRATHLVVTVSEAVRRQYLAAGLMAPERVVALLGSADAELYRPRRPDSEVRRRLGAADGELLVGMVGGLRVMKGHRTVVEAAVRLGEARAGLRFVFVGRGSQEGTIREMIFRAGLGDRITLAGFTEDLPTVMAALDVALYVPLESDGMSRVLWEYLAAGRPLVASRVGAVPEALTDGVHALLVHAGDADDLVGALRRLAADPSLRDRLGEAGRRLLLERYSGARVAAALEEHYHRLLS